MFARKVGIVNHIMVFDIGTERVSLAPVVKYDNGWHRVGWQVVVSYDDNAKPNGTTEYASYSVAVGTFKSHVVRLTGKIGQ